MQRRGEEGCEGGGKKSLILMDACIGCDKISPIYYSKVLALTVFRNSSLGCVVRNLGLLPPFSDAVTESVVILVRRLTVITDRKTKAESPPHHAHLPL